MRTFSFSAVRIPKLFAFVVLLLLPAAANAQLTDTLRACFSRGVSPTAYFDSRNSFIGNRRAQIWGIKAGAEFGGKLVLGIGYNQHTNNLTKEFVFKNTQQGYDTVPGKLRLGYVSYFARYVYYSSKHWKFSVIPAQLGVGRSRYDVDYGGEEMRLNRKTIILYEAGISVAYKVVPWFGVGTDLGFRYMIRKNKAIPENFNSPIYSFYTIIYWGELYKAVFPNTKLAKRL